MGPNPADPAILAAKLLALFIGIELAQLLAPHLMILLAGLAGAAFALMEWRQCSRWEAVGYMLAMTSVAWLFAGTASAVVAQVTGIDLAGIPATVSALGIAWVGHRWPNVGRWAIGLARKIIEQRASQP